MQILHVMRDVLVSVNKEQSCCCDTLSPGLLSRCSIERRSSRMLRFINCYGSQNPYFMPPDAASDVISSTLLQELGLGRKDNKNSWKGVTRFGSADFREASFVTVALISFPSLLYLRRTQRRPTANISSYREGKRLSWPPLCPERDLYPRSTSESSVIPETEC